MLAVGAKLGVSSATVCRRAVVLVPLLEPETGREMVAPEGVLSVIVNENRRGRIRLYVQTSL
jgi:hypothetical protein